MTTAALMILGTASHVGKSIVTAGLGRIFADEGIRVAPFKAQNMSLNSAATLDGGEIGRAQALQAEACRVPPSVDMNPVLIKPRSDTSSQVVLLGKVWGQVTAADYHTNRVEQLFPAVLQSYQRLASNTTSSCWKARDLRRKSTCGNTISLIFAWRTHRMPRASWLEILIEAEYLPPCSERWNSSNPPTGHCSKDS